MGSSSSCSTNNNNTDDSTLETNERFNFRFTDCSCQCNASKKHAKDISGQNDIPQIVFLQALMTQISRPQYDIQCDCDCGEGVKLGFLFGNTQQ